jgi:hypothetical protein
MTQYCNIMDLGRFKEIACSISTPHNQIHVEILVLACEADSESCGHVGGSRGFDSDSDKLGRV